LNCQPNVGFRKIVPHTGKKGIKNNAKINERNHLESLNKKFGTNKVLIKQFSGNKTANSSQTYEGLKPTGRKTGDSHKPTQHMAAVKQAVRRSYSEADYGSQPKMDRNDKGQRSNSRGPAKSANKCVGNAGGINGNEINWRSTDGGPAKNTVRRPNRPSINNVARSTGETSAKSNNTESKKELYKRVKPTDRNIENSHKSKHIVTNATKKEVTWDNVYDDTITQEDVEKVLQKTKIDRERFKVNFYPCQCESCKVKRYLDHSDKSKKGKNVHFNMNHTVTYDEEKYLIGGARGEPILDPVPENQDYFDIKYNVESSVMCVTLPDRKTLGCLIDSGASFSLISREVINSSPYLLSLDRQRIREPKELKIGDGNFMQTTEVISPDIFVRGEIFNRRR
jgi:hypothetical protein